MGGLKAIRAISSQWFGFFVINLNNEIYRNIFGIGILKEKKDTISVRWEGSLKH